MEVKCVRIKLKVGARAFGAGIGGSSGIMRGKVQRCRVRLSGRAEGRRDGG